MKKLIPTSLQITNSSTIKKYTRKAKHTIKNFQRNIKRNKLITEWIVPINQPIVLILQPPRSGGTMLLRLFDGHTDFHVWPRSLGFGELGWPMSPEKKLNILHKSISLEKFNHSGFIKSASNIPQTQIPIYFDKKWQLSVIKNNIQKTKNPRAIFNMLNTAAFNAWRNYQNLYGSKQWVMYHMAPHPNIPLDEIAKKFLNTYPDGHILLTTRNPLDWLASATKLEHSNNWTANIQLALNAYTMYYQNLPLNDNRVTIINFDQLVLESSSTLKKICRNLGVGYQNHLQVTTINNIEVFQNTSHNLEKKCKPDPNTLGHGEKLRKKVTQLNKYQEAEKLFLSSQNYIQN